MLKLRNYKSLTCGTKTWSENPCRRNVIERRGAWIHFPKYQTRQNK
jgi:hypothetical protein